MFGSCYPRGAFFWFSEEIVISCSSCIFGVLFSFRLNSLIFAFLVLKYFIHLGLGYHWRIWAGEYNRWFEQHPVCLGHLPFVFVFDMFVVISPTFIRFSKISSSYKLVVEFGCRR